MPTQASEDEQLIEQWKIKKLIKDLTNARGNGTSMISLIIPPKEQIPKISRMLNDELGTASNIKSRVNRQSVLTAIGSAIQKLKLYQKVPPNGLVIYCGTILVGDNKEKKLSMDFEPFKPINTSLYLCDNKFHTEALKELLQESSTFGFIVMDGNGCLFGTLSGNTQNVLYQFTVDLPKKHGRGGQSAMRFARLRLEKRHNYVRKVAENAGKLFITDNMPNVVGLVLAGSASLKTELAASDIMDDRLKPLIVKLVDVSYGGENGFNQAIELSSEDLADVKFVEEKKLLSSFMSEIAQDTGKFCFGVDDTMKALEMGAIDRLIIWEELKINRVVFELIENPEATRIAYLPEDQIPGENESTSSSSELKLRESMPLLEWLTEHYKDFGAKLHFVTDFSQEGAQFVKGFGGIGGFLRYKLDLAEIACDFDSDSDF